MIVIDLWYLKQSLLCGIPETPNGLSEAVNGRTDNTMRKGKKKDKRKTITYKEYYTEN